jgi:hypothetical protein
MKNFNFKNITVSKFGNYFSHNAENVNLFDFLTDQTHKDTIAWIRRSDKETRKTLKATLPCITVSGIFEKRSAKGLIKHSGLMCIDIDAGDNPDITDFANLRDQLKNIKNVAYAGLSVSAQGVFCIIPIEHTDKHKESFLALEECFRQIGIQIDPLCKDVSRLRVASYDEDAYLNEDAVVFSQTLEIKQKPAPSTRKPVSVLSPKEDTKKTFNNTRAQVMKVIAEINRTGIDITSTYKDWMEIGASLASEFEEEGRDLFDLVSQNHPGYHPEVCERRYDDFSSLASSFTIGTFFHHAKLSGLM